jgi:hypothetical protein
VQREVMSRRGIAAPAVEAECRALEGAIRCQALRLGGAA